MSEVLNMKVTYLKLENVAGLVIGSNRDVLEIDFTKSQNELVAIMSPNGSGKSTLLSSIQPFATPGTIDERSTIPYILQSRNGYKEIRYVDKNDTYIIKHYFRASKDTHVIKSYFMKNGEELNENGNVTSFNSLVEIHFGLTQEMMRLARIGSNVDSFISLTPARRKEYVGKLIDEIDTYLQIYKKINDDIRIVKAMIQANSTNLYNCHISDISVEDEKLASIRKDIVKYQKDRDGLMGQLAKIKTLMRDNDVDELRRKQREAESSLKELETMDTAVKNKGLTLTTTDQLADKRNQLSNQRIDIQSKINSYRLAIDQLLSGIEKLETAIHKITSDNDIQSLDSAVKSIRETILNTPDKIKTLPGVGISSGELYDMLSKLQSFNKIAGMIHTFGNKPINIYLKLRKDGKSVDKWLKEQAKNRQQSLNYTDVQTLMNKIFGDDDIIEPNCASEFLECPYYRLHTVIGEIKDKIENESYDDETLNYVQIISRNIDQVLYETDLMKTKNIPDKIKSDISEASLLSRLDQHLTFFDLSYLEDYLSLVKEYEIYVENVNKLKDYERQLGIYKKAGIEGNLAEINNNKLQINFYNGEIGKLGLKIDDVNSKLGDVDKEIALVTKYNESKKYRKAFESTLASVNKILEPLESASREKSELEFQIRNIDNIIATLTDQQHELEIKINEYKRLVSESTKLAKKNKDLNMILEAVSTKKGIPVYYMKKYLTKIQRLSNDLLRLIYDDDFKLSEFNVTPDTFEVPYIKNGKKIPDIKYASQSEVALATLALSFALATNASNKYNILLLDEMDAGLDDTNRASFLKMLYMQIEKIHAEQVFIISHNLSQMTNVPMDCICLSDVDNRSKLQNIIFE